MSDKRNVLQRPVISEKSYALMDEGTYVFVVDPRASKIEIREAVETAFGVRVSSVNTLVRKGKRKRNRRMGESHVGSPLHSTGHLSPSRARPGPHPGPRGGEKRVTRPSGRSGDAGRRLDVPPSALLGRLLFRSRLR